MLVPVKNIFSLIAGKADLSFSLVLPRYHHLACLPAFVRAALKTTLYKSRSMLSIDGRLVLKFHSRQNLFSKIPWHLLKTRHLVRNSSDRQLFPKNLPHGSLSQLLLDGRFGSKFHLGPNFFCDASLILFRSLLSITVLYSLLRHDACSVICAGTSYFIVLTDFSRRFKRPLARSGVLWITTKYVKHNTLAFALFVAQTEIRL